MQMTINLIVGFSRCGTTAVSTMLAHGGAEFTTPWPYEDDRTMRQPHWDLVFINLAQGKFVKQLEPIDFGPPVTAGPIRVVLLSRNPLEQARSHRQFLRMVHQMNVPRHYVARLASSLPALYQQAKAKFHRWPLLELTFEQIINEPENVAIDLIDFFQLDGADTRLMASMILNRSPECGHIRELELMQRFG